MMVSGRVESDFTHMQHAAAKTHTCIYGTLRARRSSALNTVYLTFGVNRISSEFAKKRRTAVAAAAAAM